MIWLMAQRMEDPPEGANSLMQLNMGEGKTSVILPLLICRLADGNGRALLEVTVRKALYRGSTWEASSTAAASTPSYDLET